MVAKRSSQGADSPQRRSSSRWTVEYYVTAGAMTSKHYNIRVTDLPAVKQIETGAILATVDFNMFKMGCAATLAAVHYLKREPLPERIMLPAEVIDKSNYKAWLVPVEERTCPE